MTTKQIVFSITLLTITSNNMFAMKNENALIRNEGYWTTTKETFFTKKTDPENQREDWYTKTKSIAEPLCTVSNAGFFIVAYSIKDSYPLSATALAAAGSASAISHAIPYKYLNTIDRILAVTSVAAVAYDAQMYKFAALSAALQNPTVLIPLIATGTTALSDFYIAHGKNVAENSHGLISPQMVIKRKTEHVWIHVLWHILAAWTAYTVLTAS